MIDLTPEARLRFDDYLRRMRGVLRGSRAVETAEVEQNVIEHVELALADAPVPVGPEMLTDVLHRLGPPERWLPEEERPMWSRVAARLQSGPEDWRLAYLAFAITMLAFLFTPVGGILLIVPAFFIARAHVELSGEVLGARRWLVVPPIAFCFAVVAFAALFVPIALASVFLLGEGGLREVFGISFRVLPDYQQIRIGAGVVAAAAGVWWMLLAALFALLTTPFRTLFLPVTARLRRVHALVIAVMGLVAGGIAALLLVVLG